MAEEIWPDWSDGPPTRFHSAVDTDPETGIVHDETLLLRWQDAHLISSLRPKENPLLPSNKYSTQWSGVYRIFVPNTPIDRCCGKDWTGTLYIGKAGTGKMSWSILRTRIRDIVERKHHAIRGWSSSNIFRQKYPWEAPAIEWAYTTVRTDYKGDIIQTAGLAETWLLRSYNDTFGEMPPLNQRS
jgi:hypothetical protein